YVEPSVRPDDSRYGENPNRLQRHTQFQVILKPDPGNSQDLFIRSLSALGIDVNEHDIRFVEDNWESPGEVVTEEDDIRPGVVDYFDWLFIWEWVSPIRALAGSIAANGGFVAAGNEDFDADFGKVLDRGLVGSFPRVQGELKIDVSIGKIAGSTYPESRVTVLAMKKKDFTFEREEGAIRDPHVVSLNQNQVLGAWGLGWEIWMDGMEITQFTYFQQAGSLQLLPVSVEITYGLERILMLLQGVDHFKNIRYADGITYGELFLENEKEMSAYYLEHASVDHLQKHFEFFEEEARSLLTLGLAIPAYDQLLKTSHAFNILDSRGFVGVTERARYFGRMRSLARQCAQLWVETRESLRHPLGILSDSNSINNDLSHKEVLETAMRKQAPKEPRAFLLEIGTEEIPPQDVDDASKQLKVFVTQLLEKQRLGHGEVFAFGTPRRLVILVEGLCSKQSENEVEVRGPPSAKAFDHQGNATKAAEGFCRKYGIPTNCLFKKVDGKTEYVYLQVKESARLALEVMVEEMPATIAKISFPKSMRWSSQIMFSRPIRWVLALHGDAIVPFMFAGVMSGNLSYGLRNTPSATLEVDNSEAYVSIMKKAGISVEFEERKNKIVEHANSLAAGVGGHLIVQNTLLGEVVNLVEAPIPILGRFKDSFLELPKDLLIMASQDDKMKRLVPSSFVAVNRIGITHEVMQKHQKYFPITDDNGTLLPYFIAVANGPINELVVRKGNEAVLRARYEDAKFFYEMDTRTRFSEFRGKLKGILFHEKLGTILDKMTRVENTVTKLSMALGIDENKLPIIHDAARLAMSDLATAVVTEFTSLSGIMARHYALRDGYSQQIAQALYEIMLPRFSGDVLPKTDAGIVLAIADRLDSLVGLFSVGCQPSSTNDPFGLRRISYGLVQVLVENDKNLNLRNALKLAAEVQPIQVEAVIIDDVHQFITRRLEQFLIDKGISPEVVRSILSERANLPCLATKSAIKLRHKWYQSLAFNYAAIMGKRSSQKSRRNWEEEEEIVVAKSTNAILTNKVGDLTTAFLTMQEAMKESHTGVNKGTTETTIDSGKQDQRLKSKIAAKFAAEIALGAYLEEIRTVYGGRATVASVLPGTQHQLGNLTVDEYLVAVGMDKNVGPQEEMLGSISRFHMGCGPDFTPNPTKSFLFLGSVSKVDFKGRDVDLENETILPLDHDHCPAIPDDRQRRETLHGYYCRPHEHRGHYDYVSSEDERCKETGKQWDVSGKYIPSNQGGRVRRRASNNFKSPFGHSSKVKLDIPEFDGKLDTDMFLDWMEAMSKNELLPKIVEAYSRPTRIIRGKDVDADFERDRQERHRSMGSSPQPPRHPYATQYQADEYYTETGFERQPQRQGRGTDIEVPEFNSKSDADAFIDWLDKAEKIFTYKRYGDPKQVNEDAFETNEEKALWSAFLEVKSKIHPGVEVDYFVETSSQLLKPLDNFFNNVFVMVEDEGVRKNRLALLKKIADLPKGIADLSVLPGF
ncbi:hypothetical protein GIB67_021578, partial [Kingdonia uniflora]